MRYFSKATPLFFLLTRTCTVNSWATPKRRHRSPLSMSNDQQSKDPTYTLPEEERVDVVGAAFFGGNKEKEEFYDPVAEEEAGKLSAADEISYSRFADRAAFEDDEVATLAKNLQQQLNFLTRSEKTDESSKVSYSSNAKWTSPLSQSKQQHPFDELKIAIDFYRHVDVAIVAAKRQGKNIRLTWTISVAWPTFWEPRAILSGSSLLEISSDDPNMILRQTDELDAPLMPTLILQLIPRFWDVYHIGMTPSAERMARISQGGGGLKAYKICQIPSRLVLQPTLTEPAGRRDTADILPNHAFSSIIKTMGPNTQRFVPTSPLEIQFQPQTEGSVQVTWSIPVSVEYASNPVLEVGQVDEESDMSMNPTSRYVVQAPRIVATAPFDGNPQDESVAGARKNLYEKVVKDGQKPKMVNGRPVFFIWQHTVKCCYTNEGGMGMAVYEWRPKWSGPSEIGIELEA